MVARLLATAATAAMILGMPPASAQDLPQSVQAAYEVWDEAFGRKDAVALGRAYTEDALFLAPDHEIRKGPKAVETFFEGLFKGGVTGHKITLIEAGDDDGKTIYGTARWRASVPGEDGKPKEIGGIAVHIFERQDDGSLKLKVHGFN